MMSCSRQTQSDISIYQAVFIAALVPIDNIILFSPGHTNRKHVILVTILKTRLPMLKKVRLAGLTTPRMISIVNTKSCCSNLIVPNNLHRNEHDSLNGLDEGTLLSAYIQEIHNLC
jgi:hypothetical protein